MPISKKTNHLQYSSPKSSSSQSPASAPPSTCHGTASPSSDHRPSQSPYAASPSPPLLLLPYCPGSSAPPARSLCSPPLPSSCARSVTGGVFDVVRVWCALELAALGHSHEIGWRLPQQKRYRSLEADVSAGVVKWKRSLRCSDVQKPRSHSRSQTGCGGGGARTCSQPCGNVKCGRCIPCCTPSSRVAIGVTKSREKLA